MKRIVVLIAVLLFGCNDPEESDNQISLVYKSGTSGYQTTVVNNDTVNTLFRNYCIRNDSLIQFKFSDSHLNLIHDKIEEIGLQSYPDTFAVQRNDSLWSIITPASRYYIQIKSDNSTKSVYWNAEDDVNHNDTAAIRLRGLFKYIDSLITTYPEFKNLPKLDCMFI